MRNRVAKISLCVLLGLSLAACERAKGVVSGQGGYAYEGYVFKGKLQRDSDDRANFSVTARCEPWCAGGFGSGSNCSQSLLYRAIR